MAVADRNLAAGTKLVAVYKGAHVECVFDGEAFVFNGHRYASPSKAGSAACGGTSVNGWRFWTPEGDFTAPAPREPKAKGVRTGGIAARTKTVRFISKMANQAGVPEGMVKYWCSSCMAGFTIEAGAAHDTCPAGHAERYEDEFGAVPVEAKEDA